MKLLIVFGLQGVILAQYGQHPPTYPPTPAPSNPSYPFPRPLTIPAITIHSSSYSYFPSQPYARKRANSQLRKQNNSISECNYCQTLKEMHVSKISTVVDAINRHQRDKIGIYCLHLKLYFLLQNPSFFLSSPGSSSSALFATHQD